MVVKNLFKKTLRDIKQSFVQFLAITIISLLGVMLFTGMSVVNTGLDGTVEEYYESSNLADLTIKSKGIKEETIDKLSSINGIDLFQKRITQEAVREDAKSRFIVHTITDEQEINIPEIHEGTIPDGDDQGMITESYAKENNIDIGDTIEVSISDQTDTIEVSGLFETAEYAYLVEDPNKSLLPDHEKFGLLYVDESFFDMGEETLYNDILVTLGEDTNEEVARDNIEDVIGNDNIDHIILKEEQPSYDKLNSDIESSSSMAKIFPYIFFLVVAVIVYISMSRTVINERNQIGIMKAFGISSFKIALHYLFYAAISVVIGGILGNVIGIAIFPKLFFNSYDTLYVLPNIEVQGYWIYVIFSLIVVLLFAITASLLSVGKIFKEMPAQSMSRKPPKKAHVILVERMGFIWKRLSYKNKLIFRNIFLNKLRVILSSLGIIGCVGLLISGFGLKEATGDFIDKQFNKIQQYDALATVSSPVEKENIEAFDDDRIELVDEMSQMKVSMEENDKTLSMHVLDKDNDSIHLFTTKNEEIDLPSDGIVFPYKVSKEHDIEVGDTVSMKIKSGKLDDKTIDVHVASIGEMYVSQDIYVSYEYLDSLDIEPDINGYYITATDNKLEQNLIDDVEDIENIESVSIKEEQKEDMDVLYQTTKSTVYIMIIMSAALVLAVVFNISSINIFERSRDIATLKVLGYHKKEVRSLVNIENLLITVFGCIVGVIFGSILFKFILLAAESEDMYFPYHISMNMILMSVLLTFGFTLLTNFLLRRKINKIEMVESLKSVE